ncbi:MAG: sigma 54-interacting transcriptional regulator [Polyangiaceae bacterium]
MVHHRPDDGFQRLVTIELAPDGTAASTTVGDSGQLPSSTAWRWIRTHRRGATIDLSRCEVTLTSGAAARGPAAIDSFDHEGETLQLLARGVTHLFVVPICAPLQRIDGMLAIEVNARRADGEPFVWAECQDALQAVAGLASPYLSHLPQSNRPLPLADPFLPVVGHSMQNMIGMLRVFAHQEETVLLSGPTGAGKSRLARWCHERSARAGHPFETICLAAVPEDLQQGELFGWKKGAFTSAVKDNPGCLAGAENGTIFIDEIDKLSLKAQASLLRVLEERRYRPLGEASGDRTANVRFIVGTNANLLDLVQEGKFRSDLYYRINVLPVRVPALRERSDEIGDWAEFMLARRHAASELGREATITTDAIKALTGYEWPGNLRQLDNIVRRAYALAQIDQGPGGDIVLTAKHVHRALAYEGGPPPDRLLQQLTRTAEAFVSEVEKRSSCENKLDIDLCDAFKGLVLKAAVERWPDDREAVKKALVLLGKESIVRSRNHWAWHEREMKLVEALHQALEQSPAATSDEALHRPEVVEPATCSRRQGRDPLSHATPSSSRTDSAGRTWSVLLLEETERRRDFLESTLAKHGGNVTRAAECLGIGRTELYRQIDRVRARLAQGCDSLDETTAHRAEPARRPDRLLE